VNANKVVTQNDGACMVFYGKKYMGLGKSLPLNKMEHE
jgi:hypothetical protein